MAVFIPAPRPLGQPTFSAAKREDGSDRNILSRYLGVASIFGFVPGENKLILLKFPDSDVIFSGVEVKFGVCGSLTV